jgi:hypothetical protein
MVRKIPETEEEENEVRKASETLEDALKDYLGDSMLGYRHHIGDELSDSSVSICLDNGRGEDVGYTIIGDDLREKVQKYNFNVSDFMVTTDNIDDEYVTTLEVSLRYDY